MAQIVRKNIVESLFKKIHMEKWVAVFFKWGTNFFHTEFCDSQTVDSAAVWNCRIERNLTETIYEYKKSFTHRNNDESVLLQSRRTEQTFVWVNPIISSRQTGVVCINGSTTFDQKKKLISTLWHNSYCQRLAHKCIYYVYILCDNVQVKYYLSLFDRRLRNHNHVYLNIGNSLRHVFYTGWCHS